MSDFNLNWAQEYLGKKHDLIIFDIGAYNFQDSINFKNHYPNSEVYSFEAYSTNVNKYGNQARNRGVKVFQLALSNVNEEKIFYNSVDMNGTEWTCSGSLLKPSEKEQFLHPGLNYNNQGEIVQCTTLNNFCEENNITDIDIIHMDVQGAEYYVVQGFGDIRPKILFCETCEYESYDGAYKIEKRLQYDTLYIKI